MFRPSTLAEKLKASGFRAEVDERVERTGFKIREAQLQKVPYMLVVGDAEVEGKTVSVRSRDGGDLGPVPVKELITRLTAERDR